MNKRIILNLLFILFILLPAGVFAADCSPYMGKATFNEFFKDRSNMSNDADDFTEVKILDGTISSVIFDDWTIQICEDNDAGNNNDADGCSSVVSLSSFTETSLPWVVLKDGNIGSYINFKTGFDAILLDANGDVIDYFSLDGYTPLEDSGCPGSSLPYDYQSSAPGASDKFIFRSADGVGDWDSAASASAPPTEDDTNDEDPNGDPAPIISVADVTVSKGVTATFTFTLEGAPKTYDVSVAYETTGGTATAGTDYTYTTGTATILAGGSTTTVDVATDGSSTSGLVYFYLYLSSPVNATVANHYPVGIILADSSAEWNMDETSWNSTADEVVDNSGNSIHGTAYNSLTTIASGYLCRAGSFDGTDDYIQIPHNSSLNGSSALTYMAWINPDSWSGINQIMAKSVHGGGSGRAQMGMFSESGVLKGRAETAAGRYEISTSLPSTGAWTHVALVFSGTELRLYINGAVVSNQTFASTTLVQNSDAMVISKRYGSNEYYFDGTIDEVMVAQSAYPASFMSTIYSNYQAGFNWDGSARSCPGALDHIEIQHDGTALTCEPESVTIRACSNADCSTLYTSDVSVTLSPTGWVGGDTQTISSGSGTLQLQNSTAGAVTLAVSSSSPSETNSTVCLDTSDSSSSCVLIYYDSGFIYTIPTQTSCATSANITVSAVRLDETTQQCVPSFANRNETIYFWTSYASPATGSSQLTLNNGSTDYTLATASPGTAVPLSFDANGEDTITVNYSDAGQLTLNSSFTGSGSESGLTMAGATTYVTKPAKFYVYSPDADSVCASADPTDVACTAYVSAGSSFNLNVRAACDDNTVTPNFIHDGISLSPTLVAPAGGNDGTLAVTSIDFTSSDNGEVTISNQSISEVGVFTVTADENVPSYFGETIIGTTADNTSENIGRFYPDYFDVSNLHSCSTDGFTYSGQSFTANVTALNTAATQTQNYTGDFVKDPEISNLGTTTLFTNNTLDNTYFTNGYGTRTDVTYTFASKDTAPETITLRAVDSDSVTSSGHTEPTTEVRSGRVNIENAFGSEILDLAVPVTVEYFDGSSYVTNTLDSNCTGITLALSDPDGTDTLTAGTGSTGETCIRDDAGLSGTGNCSAVAGEQFIEPSASGDFNTWLKAPEASYTGYIDINGTVDSWLQYDWSGAGLTNPSGRAAFGLYRGDDRIIYWREQY